MPTLDFKGKQFVYSHHLSVPFRELKVVPNKSLPTKGQKPSLDDNLIIHGDNLEALKALLPTHAGKIDCIFIDPPYNTGNEGWCYNDNVRSPLMKEWLKKSANPVDKEDLERHDKWLCMMWPRLNLLRELLSEHGILCVTLDDNEAHSFKVVMDEIFGENAFIADVTWEKRFTRSNNAKLFSSVKDHLFIFRKSEYIEVIREARDEQSDAIYSNPDNDPRGQWTSILYVNPASKEQRPNLVYEIINPINGRIIEHPTNAWKYSLETHRKHVDENRLWWGKDGKLKYPRLKRFLSEVEGVVPVDLWAGEDAGTTDIGSKEVENILGKSLFDNPKPVSLIKKVLGLVAVDAVVLDSFAGSGTTAHAVLEANKKDGGNRRFILVECEEYADTLTAERVRRIINGYDFTGTQREELYKAKITWSNFSKSAHKTLLEVEHVEKTAEAAFDKVKKEIRDGILTVTGERHVQEQAPGLGGNFTFCTLGEPIQIENLLTGKGLPAFEALARYVFYTATGQSLESVAPPSVEGFIGETDLFRVHLFYPPDLTWLRSNEAALNAERVSAIAASNSTGKRTIVFAVAKFMSQKELTKQRIEFCQLPYAVHRILGD